MVERQRGWMVLQEPDDACIADLPGVTAACCGHGTDLPYLRLAGGPTMYGPPAEVKMRELGGDPPPTPTPELLPDAEYIFGDRREFVTSREQLALHGLICERDGTVRFLTA